MMIITANDDDHPKDDKDEDKFDDMKICEWESAVLISGDHIVPHLSAIDGDHHQMALMILPRSLISMMTISTMIISTKIITMMINLAMIGMGTRDW